MDRHASVSARRHPTLCRIGATVPASTTTLTLCHCAAVVSTRQKTRYLRALGPSVTSPAGRDDEGDAERGLEGGNGDESTTPDKGLALREGAIGMRQRWLLLIGFTTAVVLVAAVGVRATLDQYRGRPLDRQNLGLIRRSTTDYTRWTVVPGWGFSDGAGISARGVSQRHSV